VGLPASLHPARSRPLVLVDNQTVDCSNPPGENPVHGIFLRLEDRAGPGERPEAPGHACGLPRPPPSVARLPYSMQEPAVEVGRWRGVRCTGSGVMSKRLPAARTASTPLVVVPRRARRMIQLYGLGQHRPGAQGPTPTAARRARCARKRFSSPGAVDVRGSCRSARPVQSSTWSDRSARPCNRQRQAPARTIVVTEAKSTPPPRRGSAEGQDRVGTTRPWAMRGKHRVLERLPCWTIDRGSTDYVVLEVVRWPGDAQGQPPAALDEERRPRRVRGGGSSRCRQRSPIASVRRLWSWGKHPEPGIRRWGKAVLLECRASRSRGPTGPPTRPRKSIRGSSCANTPTAHRRPSPERPSRLIFLDFGKPETNTVGC